jgi:hypothetical protein
MTKEKEKYTFETDDPEIQAKIKKARERTGSLTDAITDLIKGKSAENMEKGIEQTIQMHEPIAEEPSETQVSQCPFASLVVKENKNGLDSLAYCDNPQKTNLPRDRLLPSLACQKCWQRQNKGIADMKDVLFVLGHCGNVSPSLSEPELIKTIPCIKDNNIVSYCAKKEHTKDCPLISEQMRKLIVQNFC